MTRVISVFFLFLLLFACSSESPAPVKTADIQTEIIAKADGTGNTIIEASLQVKGKNIKKDIDIELPFTIAAKVGGQERKLYRTERAGEIIYTTQLPIDSTKEKYVVDIAGQGQNSASSVIVLPEPFQITSSPDQSYDRDQNISITWDNKSENGVIEAGLALSCSGQQDQPGVIIIRRKTEDTGKFVINASDIVSAPEVTVDTSHGCNASLYLSRVIQTELDHRYGKGSYSLGVQERVTNFSIKGDTTAL